MSKCPFCKSDNLYELSYKNYVRNYIKRVGGEPTSGECTYEITKNLCLGCGVIFESMEEEAYQAFAKEKEYFV